MIIVHDRMTATMSTVIKSATIQDDTVLITFLFISVLIVDASPASRSVSAAKFSLNFATRVNATGIVNIAHSDRARAKALYEGATSIGVTNVQVTYVAQIAVGDPATEYSLLVDTGSSNTWVGARKHYKVTRTSINTGNTVSVSYGSGRFSGEEYIDKVSLGNNLTIREQSIGVAKTAQGFDDVDGILGVGPIELTHGTVSSTDVVPTVVHNLYNQGTIRSTVLGIYYIPISASSSGTLTFGGYDQAVMTSPVHYVPITKTLPAGRYWGINQSITYGSTTVLSQTAGIVDTGTTLILIATDAFQTYTSMTGAKPDNSTGLLVITTAQYAKLLPLQFHIGNETYELSPNAQIWPRSLNHVIGGHSEYIYLIVADIGTTSMSGLDFINGYTFLERYYSIYDMNNSRIGFASTKYTASEIN